MHSKTKTHIIIQQNIQTSCQIFHLKIRIQPISSRLSEPITMKQEQQPLHYSLAAASIAENKPHP